jgi:hypothetical protein
MTLKEFKEAVERAGVKDSDPIFYIDMHLPDMVKFEKDMITVGWDEKLGIMVG